MGHAPLDAGFVEGLIGSLLVGLGTSPASGKRKPATRASRNKAA